MNLKGQIRKILKEGVKSWSTETKAFKNSDKGRQRFVALLLKRRHKELKEYNRGRREENPDFTGYSDDYDEFILGLKKGFPNYGGFGHMVQTTLTPDKENPLLVNADIPYLTMLMSEYILNYGEDTNERVDVVEENRLFDYIDAQFFDCSDKFFENMWDNILTGRSNYWNENIKDNMWAEIEDEVETAMAESEESGEDSEFDGDIRQEEDYFHSYWYYPLHSLGWDRITLCDWYKEYINLDDIQKHYFNPKDRDTHSNKIWSKIPIGHHNLYIIHRNSLF